MGRANEPATLPPRLEHFDAEDAKFPSIRLR